MAGIVIFRWEMMACGQALANKTLSSMIHSTKKHWETIMHWSMTNFYI
jgi:hypothetical protein